MSKKLSLSLDKGSIKSLIKQLESMNESVYKATEQAISEVMDGAIVEISTRTPVDTGDTVNSITKTIKNGKARIEQSGDHVLQIEFGDGSLFGGYPDNSKVPANMPVHQSDYTFIPTDERSKWYRPRKDGRGALSVNARGHIPHAQMYYGSQYIQENVNRVIKQKVSDALSKI